MLPMKQIKTRPLAGLLLGLGILGAVGTAGALSRAPRVTEAIEIRDRDRVDLTAPRGTLASSWGTASSATQHDDPLIDGEPEDIEHLADEAPETAFAGPESASDGSPPPPVVSPQTALVQESSDPEWTATVSAELEGMAAVYTETATSIDAVDCRETVCRIDLRHPDQAASNHFNEVALRHGSWTDAFDLIARTRSSDVGTTSTTLYLVEAGAGAQAVALIATSNDGTRPNPEVDGIN
jgi:hypothetical protein